jgi:hypothetical protein
VRPENSTDERQWPGRKARRGGIRVPLRGGCEKAHAGGSARCGKEISCNQNHDHGEPSVCDDSVEHNDKTKDAADSEGRPRVSTPRTENR